MSTGTTIIDNELQYVSASSMQTGDEVIGGCEAKYYFKYKERLPDGPEGAGQRRGIDGHARIENYLKTGQNNLDPLELEGMKFMPVHAVGKYYVEQELRPSYNVLDQFQLYAPKELLADGVPVTG